jgi:hypothetical protein
MKEVSLCGWLIFILQESDVSYMKLSLGLGQTENDQGITLQFEATSRDVLKSKFFTSLQLKHLYLQKILIC